MFLDVLAEVVERFNWICHAYCLMTNHYHLVAETVEGNLSKGMRQLNGVFTQASNRRHRRVGHLFQGRFKGILVDRDTYLQELSRYVVLNPIRAGMIESPEQWPWSSYRAMIGEAQTPKWLTVDGSLSLFGTCQEDARRNYRRFVLDSLGGEPKSIWEGLRQQIYLGDERFVERMQSRTQTRGDALTIPQAQRRPPAPSLEEIAAKNKERNVAMVAAYVTGAYSYREIAAHFGVHLATVGRVLRAAMQQCEN